MFHHRVVPPDELMREAARFEGTDPIAKSSIHVHVRPSSEPAGRRGANSAETTMTPCSGGQRAMRRARSQDPCALSRNESGRNADGLGPHPPCGAPHGGQEGKAARQVILV